MTKKVSNEKKIYEEVNIASNKLRNIFKKEELSRNQIKHLDADSSIEDIKQAIKDNLKQCDLLKEHIDEHNERTTRGNRTLEGFGNVQNSIKNELKRQEVVKEYDNINKEIQKLPQEKAKSMRQKISSAISRSTPVKKAKRAINYFKS